MSDSLPNSVVDVFNAQLDIFWLHQAVRDDFTADQTYTKYW